MNTSNKPALVARLACATALLAGSSGAAEPAIESASDGRLRRVFVPVDALEVLVSRDKKGVVLTRSEFQELYDRAVRRARAEPAPPHAVVLTAADYDARLAGPQLLIGAEIRFTQFADGWQTLSLPLSRLGLEAARLDGRPARIARSANGGELIVLTEGRGPHMLKLELCTPLENVGSDRLAAFGLTGAPSGTLSLRLEAGRRLLAEGLLVEPAADGIADVPPRRASGKDQESGVRSQESGIRGQGSGSGRQSAVNGQRTTDNGPHSASLSPVRARRQKTAERTIVYRLPVGGRGELQLRITDRAERAAGDALLFATSAFGLHVEPGEATWQALTTVQVFGRPRDELSFSVPKSLEITAVESTGLETWRLDDSPDERNRTQITLRYRGSFDAQRRIIFRGVMSVPSGELFPAPTLVLRDAASHTGRLVLEWPSGIRVQIEEPYGIRQALEEGEQAGVRGQESGVRGQESGVSGQGSEVRSQGSDSQLSTLNSQPGNDSPLNSLIPDPASGPTQAVSRSPTTRRSYFDVWREDFDLWLAARTRSREVLAGMRTELHVADRGLELKLRATVSTLYAPLFVLEPTLPADWTVTAATLDGNPAGWRMRSRQAGVHEVRIPLPQPLQPGRETTLVLSARRVPEDWPPAEKPAEIKLPEIRLPAAGVVEGMYLITGEDRFEIVPEEISGLDPQRLVGQASPPPGGPAGRMPALPGEPGERFGYSYQDTRLSGRLTIAARPPRLAAGVITLARLDRGALRSHVEARLNVEGGGLETLQVAVPAETRENIRFRLTQCGSQIIEQRSAAPADGERIWSLRFDRPLRGTAVLIVDLESLRPAAPAEERQPAVQTVHRLWFPTADRQHGYVALEAAPDRRLEVTAEYTDAKADAAVKANQPVDQGQPLAEVDPVDLPALYSSAAGRAAYVPREPVVAAFRYVAPGYRVQVRQELFEPLAVPAAVCHESSVESVLGETGEWQHHALYTLSAVGVPALEIRLPADARLWAVLVDGRPLELRRAGEAFRVNLPTVRSRGIVRTDHRAPPDHRVPPEGWSVGARRQVADYKRRLEIFYRTQTDTPAAARRLRQTPPALSAVTAEGRAIPVEILERSWKLHHPAGVLLVDSDGPYRPDDELDRASLLIRLRRSTMLTTGSALSWKLLLAAVAAGLIAVFVVGSRRYGAARMAVGTTALAITAAVVIGVASSFRGVKDEIISDFFAGAVKGKAPEVKADRAGGSAAYEDAEGVAASAVELQPGDAPGAEKSKQEAARKVLDHRRMVDAAQQQLRLEDRRREDADSDELRMSQTARQETGQPPAGMPTPPPRTPRGAIAGRQPGGDVAGEEAKPRPPQAGDPDAGQAPFVPQQGRPTAARTPEPAPGARLSVPIVLQRPTGPVKAFRYVGAAAEDSGLDLTVQDQAGGMATRLGVLAAIVAFFWLLRNRSARFRGALAAMGLAVPLALLPVAPAGWHVWLDGVFFGTAAGSILWLIHAGVTTASRMRQQPGDHQRIHAGRSPATEPPSQFSLREKKGAWRQTVTTGIVALAVGTSGSLLAQGTAQQSTVNVHQSADRGSRIEDRDEDDSPLTAHHSPNRVSTPDVVIIPYSNGGGPLKGDRVFLPQQTFLRLWNRAYPDKPIGREAPTDGLVAGAVYSARLASAGSGQEPGDRSEATVTVQGRVVLHSLRAGQVRLALPIGDVALRAARLDGRPAAVQSSRHAPRAVSDDGEVEPPAANGTAGSASPAFSVGTAHPAQTNADRAGQPFYIILERPGLHLLDLEFDLPARLEGPAGRFIVPLKPVPAGRLTFELPQPGLAVQVNGSTRTYRRRSDGDKQIIEVPVDAGGDVSVAWRPHETTEEAGAIVHADSTLAATIDDAGMHHHLAVEYSVRRGAISEAVFALPPGLKLLRIAGPDVGGWELSSGVTGQGSGTTHSSPLTNGQRTTGNGQRTLKVFLRRPIEGSTRLTLRLFQDHKVSDDAETINLATALPQSVTRSAGTIGVFAGRPLLVRAEKSEGLMRIDRSQFEARGRQRSEIRDQSSESGARPDFAWRFHRPEFELQVSAARRKDRTAVLAEHAVVIEPRRMRLSSRFTWNLAGAPRERLTVLLPENLLVLEVDAGGMADWYLSEDRAMLTVELSRPAFGRAEVAVVGVSRRNPDAPLAEIIVPVPLYADELRNVAAVWLDKTYTARADAVQGWTPIEPEKLPAELRERVSRPVQFAFRTDDPEPNVIAMLLQQAEPAMRGDSVTIVTVADTAVHYTFLMKWTIRRAASDSFVFSVPDWIAGRLEFIPQHVPRLSPGTRNGRIEAAAKPDVRRLPGTIQGAGNETRVRFLARAERSLEESYVLTATAALPPPEWWRAGEPTGPPNVRTPRMRFEEATAGAGQGGYRPLATQAHYAMLVNQSRLRVEASRTPQSRTPQASRTQIERRDLPETVVVPADMLARAAEIHRMDAAAPPPAWSVSRPRRQRGAEAAVNLADLTTVLAADGTWRTRAVYKVKNRGRQFLALRLPDGARILSVFVKGRPSRPVGRMSESVPPSRRNQNSALLIPLPQVSAAALSFDVRLVLAGRLQEPLPDRLRPAAAELELLAPHVISTEDDKEFGVPLAQTLWTVHVPREMDVRLVDDPERSNLTLTTAERAEAIRKRLALREANELARFIEQPEADPRRQIEAWSNIKEVERGLQRGGIGETDSGAEGKSTEVQKLFEEQQKLLSNIRRLEERMREVTGSKRGQAPFAPPETFTRASQAPQMGPDPFRINREQALRLQSSNVAAPRRSETAEATDKRFQFKVTPARTAGDDAQKKQPERRRQSREQIRALNQAPQKQQQPAPPAGAEKGEARIEVRDPRSSLEPRIDGSDALWAQPGGLSLDIELPTEGRTLTFSKAGGAPRLTLAVRHRPLAETGLTALWSAVWLLLGLGVVLTLRGPRSAERLRRAVPLALAAAGLLAFLFLPGLAAIAGLAAFIAGLVLLAARSMAAQARRETDARIPQ